MLDQDFVLWLQDQPASFINEMYRYWLEHTAIPISDEEILALKRFLNGYY